MDSTPMGKLCNRWSRDQPQLGSFFQGPRQAEERESLRTRLVYAKKSSICMKMKKAFSYEWFRNKNPFDTEPRGNSEMACYTFNEKDARPITF